MTRRTVEVTGMSCSGCEQSVEGALASVAGVTSVTADHEADAVELTAEDGVDDATLQTAIEEAGYEVTA